ncbi:uncharacterized protein C14orf119 [Aphidius gifuensis]|nr:uncharacterized protein C14orf119 [Aphidius gifuensis]
MSSILSSQAQLRYIVEWFQEWSDMQRMDFLNIFIEHCGPPDMVNGIVSGIEGLGCKDEPTRPPSLFQCRVKLFQEWSQNWTQLEKDNLLVSIKNIDSKFADKYERRLTSGNANDNDDN